MATVSRADDAWAADVDASFRAADANSDGKLCKDEYFTP